MADNTSENEFRVAYLGPPASFSNQVCFSLSGSLCHVLGKCRFYMYSISISGVIGRIVTSISSSLQQMVVLDTYNSATPVLSFLLGSPQAIFAGLKLNSASTVPNNIVSLLRDFGRVR
jgi:hypothetical protein